MKKTLLSIVTAICAIFSVSAAVDLNAVKVDVTMNPVHYKELLRRFIDGDHTLTTEEMTTVYYGYAYTPEYSPGETYDDIVKLYDEGDYSTALFMAEAAMLNDPLSLGLNIIALSCAEKLKDQGDTEFDAMKTVKIGNRCEVLSNAIISSGRGTFAQSPFIVIDSNDIEYLLRNIFGVDKILGQTTVGDVLAVKFTFPGRDRQHILYFDNAPERQFKNK